MASELVDIPATLVHETKPNDPDSGAFLIDHGGKDKCWVPKSMVEYDRAAGIFTMPRNLAYEKGIL